MGQTADRAYLVWSLAMSADGTLITGSGNSGPFSAANLNQRSAVDLRLVDDVWLSVACPTVTGTTPSLTVSLDAYDYQGNLFAGILTLPALTAAGAKVAFGGRHAGTGGNYFVLPEWGRISWAVTGTTPSFQNAEIELYAR